MSKINTIIFDLDDTLYPQLEYTRQCLHATVNYISDISGENKEVIKVKLDEILEKNGIEYKFIFNDLFKEISFDGMPKLKIILELFWSCTPEIKVFDGVLDVLTQLKTQYRLAILTDGHVHIQEQKIDTLGIRDFFEYVLITDSLGVEYRKPSPAGYKKILEEMKISAQDCIYVGNDPRKDFLACKELGINTVRIRQGDYKNLTLDKIHEADCEIDDIQDLLNIIK